MTKKPQRDAKRKNPKNDAKFEKETLKDLDVPRKDKDSIKGGAAFRSANCTGM